MSLKNFMSYDDAATVLGEYADKVNELKSGLTNLADVPVYTTDSALISAFRGKHNYYRTFIMSDSTKTMALLNAVDEEKVYVALVENQQMWSNHLNFYAFIQDSVWVGLLNIGENSISVPVCTKLAKNSELTNIQNDVKLNTQDLTTPSRTKNVLPMTLAGIKSLNTTGTWNNNVYTVNGVDFAVNTDTNGNVINITVNGTSSGVIYFYVANNLNYLGTFNGKYTVNGGVSGGGANTYALQVYSETNSIFLNCYESRDYIIEHTTYSNSAITSAVIVVRSGVTVENLVFTPMIRLSTETDPTFAPYIPSVDARLDAVESGLTNVGTYSSTGVVVGTYQGHVLYRREFDISALPNNDVGYTATNLGNVAIVDMYGIATNGTVYIPLPFIAIGSNMTTLSVNMYFNDNREIVIATGSDRSGFSAKVVLYYYYVS